MVLHFGRLLPSLSGMMKNLGITVIGLVAASWVLPDVRAQTCNPDFLITETPNGPGRNALNAVAAFDVNDVWAVGYTNDPPYQTLIEHWDGSSWSILPSPNPAAWSQLLGVAGVAPDDLWAVGYSSDNPVFSTQILTEHWDGAQWSVVPAPILGGYERLNAVAAVATDDVWAVGEVTYRGALFLHWDGLASIATVISPQDDPMTPCAFGPQAQVPSPLVGSRHSCSRP